MMKKSVLMVIVLYDEIVGGQGGGVCLYIAFNLREDLTSESIESLWIDILLPHTKHITLGVFTGPEETIILSNLSLIP